MTQSSFTYGTDGTAPSVQKDYPFERVSPLAGDDPEVSIPGPSVVVRTVPTALTLSTSANNFFLGESITVTVELDARAPAGGSEVALAADSGTFSMAKDGEAIISVTIDDAAESTSAMVYYTNDVASEVTPVMLTATATVGEVELTDSASVSVKSTISNLQVNGMSMPDPVRGDADN